MECDDDDDEEELDADAEADEDETDGDTTEDGAELHAGTDVSVGQGSKAGKVGVSML